MKIKIKDNYQSIWFSMMINIILIKTKIKHNLNKITYNRILKQ